MTKWDILSPRPSPIQGPQGRRYGHKSCRISRHKCYQPGDMTSGRLPHLALRADDSRSQFGLPAINPDFVII